MKIRPKDARRNRERILKAASRLFRERGANAVSVGTVCEAVGLTHGAMYSHFRSKDELIAEAFSYASDDFVSKMEASARVANSSVLAMIETYVSREHRDSPGTGCPLASNASETGRGGVALSEAFSAGFERSADLVELTLRSEGQDKDDARARAITIMALVIGAAAASRAIATTSDEASREIIRAARVAADLIAGSQD